MVTKRELKRLLEKSIANQERILEAVGVNKSKETEDKINNWLKDDRVDEAQQFLHRGIK